MRVSRVLLAILAVWFGHWSSGVLPLVHFGSVAIPGFTVISVASALALFGAVAWFMIVRPALVPPRYVRGVRVWPQTV